MSTSHKNRNRAFIGVAVVAVIIAGVAIERRVRIPKRLAVVEAGVLLRSAQPSTRQIGYLRDEYGVKSILIVRTGKSDRVPDEMEHARSLGLEVIHIPIESREPIPPDQIRAFFDCVDDPDNQPVLIHCSAGRHRTGLLCALYRIERQGWTVERAKEEMLSFRFDVEDHTALLRQLEAYRPGDSVATDRSATSRGTTSRAAPVEP